MINPSKELRRRHIGMRGMGDGDLDEGTPYEDRYYNLMPFRKRIAHTFGKAVNWVKERIHDNGHRKPISTGIYNLANHIDDRGIGGRFNPLIYKKFINHVFFLIRNK